MNDKAKENRLRRQAIRQGYTLKKSKARNWNINDHQGWTIVNSVNNVQAGPKFDLSLEEVEKFLMEDLQAQKNQ